MLLKSPVNIDLLIIRLYIRLYDGGDWWNFFVYYSNLNFTCTCVKLEFNAKLVSAY